MKKIALALALTASVLVGCSNDSDKEPVDKETVTVTESPKTSETEDESNLSRIDEDFVEVTRDELGLSERDIEDEEILGAAEEVCGLFDDGATVEDVLTILDDAQFDPYSAGFFMTLSVGVYCPEYNQDIDDFLESGVTA